MENIVKEYKERFDRNHRRQHRYACLLGVLALLVCLAVFWRLKLVGTAMTNEASCGLQEHTHTDSCYTTVLDCTAATQETGTGEHIHTDACYKRELICTLPEHTHTADCYSDPEADTEEEADWTRSFPQEALTGDWAQDTVTIASSQIGYAESTRNWQLNDDGTRGGYTRYGAWYGSPYGGWNGMFAAFCLHYAGVDEDFLTTANAAGVNAWVVALCQAGQLQGPGHEAVPGDIIFLGSDDKIETCAVVADVDTASGVPTLTLIAGDVDNTVAELTVPADSDTILGYAATADAFAAYTQDDPDKKPAAPETATPEQDEQEDEDTPFMTLEADSYMVGASVVQSTPLDLAGSYTVTNADGTTETKYYLTDGYANSTVYDKVNNFFNTELHFNFAIPKDKADDVGGHMKLTLPDGISIPTEVQGTKYTGKYGEVDAFDFTLKKGTDGKYYVDMQFREDFLQKFTQDTIEGDFFFGATIGADKVDSTGKIEFVVRENLKLTINSDQIKYDANETARSDIHVQKSGSYLSNTGELYYEATITSTKGTPGRVQITDTLTGLDKTGIDSLEIVSVTRNDGTSVEDYKITSTDLTGKTFTYELPVLPKAEDSATPNTYKVVYKYKLTTPPENGSYSNTATNTLTATSKDKLKNDTVTDSDKAEVKVEDVIEKRGDYDSTKGVINWTITVNNQGQNDIAGKELTDSMFAENSSEVSGKILRDDLKIASYYFDKDGKRQEDTSGTASYTVETVKDADNKEYVKSVKFNADADGTNHRCYVITYSTPAKAQFNDWTQTNTVTFDGRSIDTGVVVKAAIVNKTAEKQSMDANGNATVKWTVTITPPSGGIPKDTTATDVMSVGNGEHYLNKEQAEALYNTLAASEWVKESSIKFRKTSAGPDVIWQDLAESDKVVTVTFTFAKKVPEGENLTFSYVSTVKMNDSLATGVTVEAKNEFSLNNGSKDDATVSYYKYGVKKYTWGDKWGTDKKLTSRDTEFYWSVQVYFERQAEKQPEELTIVDTLPKEVEPTKVWIGLTQTEASIDKNQVWKWNGDNTFTQTKNGSQGSQYLQVNSIDLVKNPDGTKTITIKLDPRDYIQKTTIGSWFHVCYSCKLTQEAWDAIGPGETETFRNVTNRVDITTKDNKPYGSASSTGVLNYDRTGETPQPVGKTGEVKADEHAIDYRLELNPYGKTYKSGSPLKLTDVMTLVDDKSGQLSAYIKEGSVKLYHATRNADGKLIEGEPLRDDEWSWKSYRETNAEGKTEYKIEADLPDGVPLVLKYRYKFEYSGTESNISLQAANTATLSDVNNGSDGKNQTLNWVKASGGGSVQNALTLVKVDSRTSGITLPNAKFRVYAVDKNGTETRTERTYTTDKEGMLSITKDADYDFNTIYFLQEEEAPYPYTADTTTKYAFYFSHPSQADNKPDGYATTYNNPIDLTSTSRTDYVANTKESLDVEVTKQWTLDDGSTPLDSAFRIPVTVRLWRFAVSTDLWNKYQSGAALTEQDKQVLAQGRAAAEEFASAELNAANNWQRAFRYLSVQAEAGKRYIYFITEDAVPGFNTDLVQTLPTKDANGVWVVKADIKNRMVSQYELPKTGGNGTTPYMAGGLALMAASLLCGYCKKRRRKEGRQTG